MIICKYIIGINPNYVTKTSGKTPISSAILVILMSLSRFMGVKSLFRIVLHQGLQQFLYPDVLVNRVGRERYIRNLSDCACAADQQQIVG
jgi:hypothetical protein